MTFDPASVATVGKPAPEFLRMAALGAGLRGGITPATFSYTPTAGINAQRLPGSCDAPVKGLK